MSKTYGAEDLEQLWQTALKKYKEKTGKELQHDSTLSVDEMQDELSKSFPGKDSRDVIVKQSLERAILLGAEIAGNVASNVFPGAGVLFKAAKPLIEITHHYQQYYTLRSVEDTLGKILPHFKRVQTYVISARQGARISEALMSLIHQVLVEFLHVCAIYTEVRDSSRHKRGRFKHLCKCIVGLDGGIKQHLDRIKELAKLEGEQNSAEANGTLLEGEGRRIRVRNRTLIKDTLKIEENLEFQEPWAGMQDKLQREFVEGIGLWLPALEEFSTWKDDERHSVPVLALEAESGFGKTHLCSYVVKMLRENETPQKRRKSFVAFFYFKGLENSRASRKETGSVAKKRGEDASITDTTQQDQMYIKDALISLIWQLTLVDYEYQSFVASKMEHTTGRFFRNAHDLWDTMFRDYATFASSKRPKTFFLVVDGLDLAVLQEAERESVTYIISQVNAMSRNIFQIRLLITGNNKLLQTLNINQGEECSIIHILDHRNGDMEAFIRSNLRKSQRDWTDKDHTDILLRIEDKFCGNDQYISGSYRDILPALNEVAQTYGNSELQGILERDPQNSIGVVPWQLKTLEKQLDYNGIDEFNDILVCIVLMRTWPSVKQLTAFAWLNKDTRHQWDLEQRIRQKYIQFFKLSDDNIVTSDETMAYFHARDHQDPEPSFVDDPDTDGSAFGPDIGFIKKVAQVLCQEGVSDRLEQLLKPSPKSTPRIDMDFVTGNVKVVLCLLRAVCTWRRKGAEPLHDYAAQHLLSHFGRVTTDQLRSTPIHIKREIGYLLYEFFMDRNSVDTWVKSKVSYHTLYALFWPDDKGTWVDEKNVVLEALRWQEDPHVRIGAQEAARQKKYQLQMQIDDQTRGVDGQARPPLETEEEEPAKQSNEGTIGSDTTPNQEDASQTEEIGAEKDTDQVEDEPAEHVGFTEAESANSIPEESVQDEPVTVYEEDIEHGGDAVSVRETSPAAAIPGSPKSTNDSENGKSCGHDLYQSVDVVLKPEDLMRTIPKTLAAFWLDRDVWDAEFWLGLLVDISNTVPVPNFPKCDVNGNEWKQRLNKSSLFEFWDWAVGILGHPEDAKCLSRRHTRLAESVLTMLFTTLNNQEHQPGGEHLKTRQHELYNIILDECRKARTSDSTNWRASWCITRAQIQLEKHSEGKYSVLERLEALLGKLHEKRFRTEHKTQHDAMIDSFLKLCDERKKPFRAARCFGDLAAKFPNDVDLIRQGFEWIQRQKDPVSSKRLMSSLVMMPETGRFSPMTTLLHSLAESPEFHDSLWSALYGDPGLITKCYTDAIQAMANIPVVARVYLRFYYGLTLYYLRNLVQATEVWENIRLDRSHFRAYPKLHQFQAHILERLALCYVQLTRFAVAKADESDRETEYMRKVSALIIQGEEGVETAVTNVRYLKLSLCRIYKLNGQMEEAKKHASNYVNAAAKLLSNDTLDDDCRGFMELGEIFLALGDDENAKIAWSMINDMDDGRKFYLPLFCDGGCGHMWETYPDTEVNICRDCANVRLDKKCFEKLKNGKLRSRVCSRDHEFFVVKGWDGKAKKQLKDRIEKAGNSARKMHEDWLKEVKDKYVVKQPKSDNGRQFVRLRGAVENLGKFFRKRVPVSENDDHGEKGKVSELST